jgi:predicted MFS family arabinose efflux permease
MKVTPEDNRPGYTAIYMTLMNIGIFIFPMIGVTLGGRFGIGPTLIGCGLLSILGASSFWWRPVQTPEPKPYVSPNPAVKPSQSKPVQSPD